MKKLISILLLIILVSCNSKNDQKNSNTAIVNQYFEHFNNHDWKAMATMYAPKAAFKDPTLGEGIVVQSRAEIIRKYSELNEVFADINDEIVNIYPAGKNHIVVEFISTGTAPDGSKFSLPICTIFTIENALITKDFSYFDNFEE